jgi:hypothetical protein
LSEKMKVLKKSADDKKAKKNKNPVDSLSTV